MLPGLTTLFKSSLKFTTTSGYHEYPYISLCCTRNHVGYIVFVARSIQDRVAMIICFEQRPTNLYGLSFSPLLLRGVHNKCEKPRLSVALLGLLFESIDGSGIDLAHQIKNTSRESGLSSIDVANEDEVHMISGVTINFLLVVITISICVRIIIILCLLGRAFLDISVFLRCRLLSASLYLRSCLLFPILHFSITLSITLHNTLNLRILHESIRILEKLHGLCFVSIRNFNSSDPKRITFINIVRFVRTINWRIFSYIIFHLIR
mmetsp:Transcript_15881/g.23919  ORF Transcript_15881/g.23919 Transcript_15881/m.23919 type:complete len:264 (-) Transcript_15881:255-1046(-)